MRNKATFGRCAVGLLLVMGMVAAAVLCQNDEIIFPEIAALVIGAVVSPTLAWQVSRPRFLLCMTVASVLGTLIPTFSPLPLYVDLLLAVVVAAGIVWVSQTTFFPVISALVLPVLMNTKTVIYPVSVVTLAALILLARTALIRGGALADAAFSPVRRTWRRDGARFAAVVAVIALYAIYPVCSGHYFLIAPPLLVLFCEVAFHPAKFADKFVKLPLLTLLVAACGSLTRWLLLAAGLTPGVSRLIAALFTCVVVLWTMTRFVLYCPPVAALGFLPLIIPKAALLSYSIWVTVTATLICLSGKCLPRLTKRAVSGYDNSVTR